MATTPQELHAEFDEHFRNNDLDGLLALYEDDAVFLPEPGTEVTGRDGIRAALTAFMAIPRRSFLFQHRQATQYDELALLHATWVLEKADPGDGADIRGTTSDIARRQPDGTWLFAIDSPFGFAG